MDAASTAGCAWFGCDNRADIQMRGRGPACFFHFLSTEREWEVNQREADLQEAIERERAWEAQFDRDDIAEQADRAFEMAYDR